MDEDPIFALGDIHGHLGELERVLALIDEDPAAGAPVVFLGDYVDRGPDSRGVIERLIAGRANGAAWVTLCGNHDRTMLDFLDGTGRGEGRFWLSRNMGGRATLASYGVDCPDTRPVSEIREEALQAIPETHIAFLRALETMHVTETQVFAHAGIRPGVPLDAQDEADLLWIRDPFLDETGDHGRLVVHGHTAIDAPIHYGNRLNMDGGAAYGRPLHAAVLLGRDAFVLTAFGRARL
ncbi:metallophosphoesterase family protein [Litorisediminicola beolgyonensis]|uniref:Metallophosphoesterase family protein n=1 Tax=Litorisediminicola beolgyonensis TaxID=1173614 RepID=A0ABW3ZHI8_9RHOB